jgi:hypothetical protein
VLGISGLRHIFAHWVLFRLLWIVLYSSTGMATTLPTFFSTDIVLTTSDALLQHIIESLNREFAMTDMWDLHDFLHMSVTRSSDGLFLCQHQYALEILRRVGMSVTLRRRLLILRQNCQLLMVHLWLICLPTGVWLALCSTLL